MLWKQDRYFPDWAWVYEAKLSSFYSFLDSLKRVASEDGLKIEFIRLSGPEDNDYKHAYSPHDFHYNARTLIISDAARLANYQRDDGRIINFTSCTPWRLVERPQEVRETPGDKYTYAERGAIQYQESLLEKPEILRCRRSIANKTYVILFVKAKHPDVEGRTEFTSSTKLRRDISKNKDSESLRSTLQKGALSGDCLWERKAQWIGKIDAPGHSLITLNVIRRST